MGSLLVFAGGLALLLVGSEAFVRGAAALAARLGVAPVIIGMTVVAFGTSTPELVVSVLAARSGSAGIAFGNVVGSNIANIGLLRGITALVRPLVVHRSMVTREIPMMLLACGAGLALAPDGLHSGGADRLARGDGVALLLFFVVFLYYTIQDARRQRADVFLEESAAAVPAAPKDGFALMLLLVVGGLAGVVGGGHFLVQGAVDLARGWGVPDTVIGLTLVAVGTSVPELATSLVAARRGHADLALGNIVGSNIYNMLFILGIASSIAPVDVPAGGRIDLLVMTVFSVALLPLARTGHRLSRVEGFVLLAGYAAYTAWLVGR